MTFPMRPRPSHDLAVGDVQRRPLRIAQVAPPIERVPPSAYGGTERIVYELTTKLVDAGHDVTVFASGDSDVPCRLIPTSAGALRPAGIDDFKRWFASTIDIVRAHMDEFDIIHSHLESWSIPLAKSSRVPVVSTFHGRLDLPWTLHAFDSPPDGLVAISRSQASAHPNLPWTIIHNGLTLDRAPFRQERSDALCFVGRVDPEKGILDAMEIARRTGRRLRIAAKVGTLRHQVDYYTDVFKPALKKAGRNVEYLGEVEPAERDALFADSAATLMPGAWPEPFGLVCIESLACGTPVLARRVGGLPEIIREGVDGFFCDDVTAFQFNLEKVPALDRAAIRSRVIDRFSADRMTDRYQDLYARMIDRHAIASSRADTAARLEGVRSGSRGDSDSRGDAGSRGDSGSRAEARARLRSGGAAAAARRSQTPASPGTWRTRLTMAHGGLRFTSPDDPGITRVRSGRSFRYQDARGRAINDEAELERFRRIVIPPAWTEVWISPDPNGHLQAVGRDARGRRQYRYHPTFRARKDRDKFARLARFGRALPRIRQRVRADLGSRGLTREKVIAAVVALLDSTHLRIGNQEYARLNKSFGLSTLRTRHATVTGGSIAFRFRGKGGRMEERLLVDKRLAAVVRRCQELPGQALFQYPDAEDPKVTHKISSEDVNAYIREAAGDDAFSGKDFRTWAATLIAFRLRDEAKVAIEQTAEQLGDTVSVARNSYIHPAVLDEIEEVATLASKLKPAKRAKPAPAPKLPPPTRRDELALLAFLRSGSTGPAQGAPASRSATRSKAGGRRGVAQPGRRVA